MARSNAERLGVLPRLSLQKASFAEGPDGPFDIVVANPPYIRSDAIAGLQREVRDHDPRAALDGGPDGLAAYRAILARAGKLIGKGGILAFEVGHDQAESVAALCREAGLPGGGPLLRILPADGALSWRRRACRGLFGRGQKKRLEKSGDSG